MSELVQTMPSRSGNALSFFAVLGLGGIVGWFLYQLALTVAGLPQLGIDGALPQTPPSINASISLSTVAVAVPFAVGAYTWLFLADRFYRILRLIAVAAVPAGIYLATEGAVPSTIGPWLQLPGWDAYEVSNAYGTILGFAAIAFMLTGLAAVAFSQSSGRIGIVIALLLMIGATLGLIAWSFFVHWPTNLAQKDLFEDGLVPILRRLLVVLALLGFLTLVSLFMRTLAGSFVPIVVLACLCLLVAFQFLMPLVAAPTAIAVAPIYDPSLSTIDSGTAVSNEVFIRNMMGDSRIAMPVWVMVGLLGTIGALIALSFGGGHPMHGFLAFLLTVLAVAFVGAFMALTLLLSFWPLVEVEVNRADLSPETVAQITSLRAFTPVHAIYALGALVAVSMYGAVVRRD